MNIKRTDKGHIIWSDEVIEDILKEAEKWFLRDPDNVFIGDFFSRELGIATRSFIEKLNQRPYLKDGYARLKEIQEYKVLMRGLKKEFDSSLVKFVLANKFDYTEKSEVAISGLDLKDLVSFEDE